MGMGLGGALDVWHPNFFPPKALKSAFDFDGSAYAKSHLSSHHKQSAAFTNLPKQLNKLYKFVVM